MKRSYVIAGAVMLGLSLQAAEGKHIARATLQTRAGATVASAQADPNGCVRFTNVPPGEYQVVITNADGRSVTLADLDGDGRADIIIEGRSAAGSTLSTGGGAGKVSVQDLSVTRSTAPAPSGSGSGAGKVNVQDLSVTKQTQGSSFGEKTVGGALPGGAVVSSGVVSPRDHASGLPTGKRMHKPMVCLVDWDLAKGKGGYASERVAQAEGQQLPDTPGGRCVVKVVADEQPGTIEVLSWSWGASQAGKHTKTGHVTLMK
ncbi:MAG: hypothetical protein HXX12_10320 [Geothrix sp.]|uniref:hypothetical protein n=1 Tax=Geothrix sp. TaxID=1962974 RepID=UPI00179A99E1|nr:hypothetical protein [Geothrix sp.]NWJ41354.1 hypothetical protein [Geothrix sp.]WIL20659.1 MAG: hypothetical protein QOZ81_003240 [Geothrix sp.]